MGTIRPIGICSSAHKVPRPPAIDHGSPRQGIRRREALGRKIYNRTFHRYIIIVALAVCVPPEHAHCHPRAQCVACKEHGLAKWHLTY